MIHLLFISRIYTNFSVICICEVFNEHKPLFTISQKDGFWFEWLWNVKFHKKRSVSDSTRIFSESSCWCVPRCELKPAQNCHRGKKPKWDLFSVLDKSYARYSKSKCTWRFAGFSHYQSKCIPFFIGLLVVIHDGLLGMMTNFLLQDVDPKLPQMLDTFAAYLKK